jgi:hypothetical protein
MENKGNVPHKAILYVMAEVRSLLPTGEVGPDNTIVDSDGQTWLVLDYDVNSKDEAIEKLRNFRQGIKESWQQKSTTLTEPSANLPA